MTRHDNGVGCHNNNQPAKGKRSMRGNRKPRRMMYWGEEAKCSRCRGWWPTDSEFYVQRGDGIHSQCKACEDEQRPVGKRVLAELARISA